MESLALIAAAAVLAGAVASVSGFGIGSLLTPLLVVSVPMPTADAVAVLAVPHALATAIRWARLRHEVHAPTFREFGVASAAGGRNETHVCENDQSFCDQSEDLDGV